MGNRLRTDGHAPWGEVFVPALAAWPAAQSRPAPPAMLQLVPRPTLNQHSNRIGYTVMFLRMTAAEMRELAAKTPEVASESFTQKRRTSPDTSTSKVKALVQATRWVLGCVSLRLASRSVSSARFRTSPMSRRLASLS